MIGDGLLFEYPLCCLTHSMPMRRRHLIQAALATSARPFSAMAQDSGDIVVAHIGPFTVLPAKDTVWLHEGFVAAFDEVNARGGINGRKVRMLKFDDAYSYEGFKARLAEAMTSKPVALLSPLGSATLKEVLDTKLLDQNDVTLINAVPGAAVLRNPGHPRLFHIRAGDDEQIAKIVSHARSLNIQSMGVLYQNIPIGSSGFASAQEAAKGTSLEVIGVESKIDDADLAKGAQEIAKRNPHAALVVGNPKFMGQAIAALRAAGVSQQIFALSYLPSEVLFKVAGKGARGVGIAQTFPNPQGVTQPLHRAFRAAMQKSHPDLKGEYTTFNMEGYITARVFIEAARRAKSITPAGIAEALQRAGEIDLGGFRVNFSKGNEGSKWVDIGVVTADGKLRY